MQRGADGARRQAEEVRDVEPRGDIHPEKPVSYLGRVALGENLPEESVVPGQEQVARTVGNERHRAPRVGQRRAAVDRRLRALEPHHRRRRDAHRLGHEDPATTHLYIEADLAMKEAALRRIADPAPAPLRFRARDRLLAFLDAL